MNYNITTGKSGSLIPYTEPFLLLPETFEHISVKRTDHPPLWTIERERPGDIRWTTEDGIGKYEKSKIVVVGQKDHLEITTQNKQKSLHAQMSMS